MNKSNTQREPLAHDIWPHFKRLMELSYADPVFLKEFLAHPGVTLRQYGLRLEPDTAREAIMIQMGQRDPDKKPGENPYQQEFAKMIQSVYSAIDHRVTPDKIRNDTLRVWVTRQRKRIAFESSVARAHIRGFTVPVCFELSDGCSVHCPFCCLAAEHLKSIFRYTQQNSQLWRDVLLATKEVVGEITSAGVCYLATEPLDNPDYEAFISDFYHITGCYPQTTTAASVRDVRRTRQLMELLGENHLAEAALRMSVISLQQLKEIHQAFTPEELTYVEVLPNNPESLYSYGLSGRSIQLADTLPTEKFEDSSSCICVSGFIVNLSRKTIMLVTPCRPDERYPLGMKIYETVDFTDAFSYRKAIETLIEKWMPREIPEDTILGLNRYITCKRKGSYLEFHGDGVKRVMSGNSNFYRCMELIGTREITLQQIYQELNIDGYSQKVIKDKMQQIFDLGYLEE